MTEIETLKVEAANLFFARENFQQNIVAVNQRLQELAGKINQLEKEQENGNKKVD